MEKLIRAQVLHYRQQAEDAMKRGDEWTHTMIVNEMHGFRMALEMVLSQSLIREIFRPTEE